MKLVILLFVCQFWIIKSASAQCADQMEESKACMKDLMPPPPHVDMEEDPIHEAVLDCFKDNQECYEEVKTKQEEQQRKIQIAKSVHDCMDAVVGAASKENTVQTSETRQFYEAMQNEVDECLANQDASSSNPFGSQGQGFQNGGAGGQGRFPGRGQSFPPRPPMGQQPPMGQPSMGQQAPMGQQFTMGQQPPMGQQASMGQQPPQGQGLNRPACSPAREERMCIAQAMRNGQQQGRDIRLQQGDSRGPFKGNFQSSGQQQGPPGQYQQQGPMMQGQNFQQIQECQEKVSQECRPQTPETMQCLCEVQYTFQRAIHNSEAFQSCLNQAGISDLDPPPNMCGQGPRQGGPPPPPPQFQGNQKFGQQQGQNINNQFGSNQQQQQRAFPHFSQG